MSARKNSSAMWIVVCVLCCGAVWAWQSEELTTRLPASIKFLSSWMPQSSAKPADETLDHGTTAVPRGDNHSSDLGEQLEPFVAQSSDEFPRRREPAASLETSNPFAREPRPTAETKRTERSRVIPTAYQDEPNATQAIPETPVVAAKDKPAAAPVKALPGKAKGSSPMPLEDVAGKGTQILPDDKIEQLIQLGDYVTAQRELSKWYWRTPSRRDELRPKLDDLAKALYFSPQPLFREPYVVQPGDQLRVIAQRYKLTWEYLANLNRTDPKKIRVGQKLKVVEGPFSALVILSNYELIIHLNGSFVKSYRIGAGKDGVTPVGTFPVKNKLADPTYFGPDGVIANNDPKNPLGERWIDIGDSYGIHGTIEPDTIGKNESRGCIRLLNTDVEEVYNFLIIGSEVKIQR